MKKFYYLNPDEVLGMLNKHPIPLKKKESIKRKIPFYDLRGVAYVVTRIINKDGVTTKQFIHVLWKDPQGKKKIKKITNINIENVTWVETDLVVNNIITFKKTDGTIIMKLDQEFKEPGIPAL